MQHTHFSDCKIVGAEFFRCDQTSFAAHFQKCLIHYCNFAELNMKNANFSKSKLKECYFTNTHLVGANFEEVDCLGTLFHHCDLSKADFSTAFNYNIDPKTNKLTKAKFSLPEAVSLLRSLDIVIS